MKVRHFFRRRMFLALACLLSAAESLAADKLVGFHSARTMSQAMPWIAEEAGLFKKYELDFQLVYISSAPIVTAALLLRTAASLRTAVGSGR